jgi:hypothetical protein
MNFDQENDVASRPAAQPNQSLTITQLINSRSVADVLATGAEQFPGHQVIQADWNQQRNWCSTNGVFVPGILP